MRSDDRYTVWMQARHVPQGPRRISIGKLFRWALTLLLLAYLVLTLFFMIVEVRRWMKERAWFEGQADHFAAIATEIALTRQAVSSSNHLLAARGPRLQGAAGPTPAPHAPPLPTLRFLGDPAPDHVDVTAVPARVEPIDRQGQDLVNILLLGSDSELGEANQRTDTIIVLSVNRDTGTASMLSLPRDLLVWVPAWRMGRINRIYGHGELGGWKLGGFDLLRQTILYNLGINAHYHVLVDYRGLQQIVNFVDGVDIVVECAIKDKEHDDTRIPDEARKAEGEYWLLDAGVYEFDGLEALWYARSRRGVTDLERSRRQQQILRGVWSRLRESGRVGNPAELFQLWRLAQEMVHTDLGVDVLVSLLPLVPGLGPDDVHYRTLQLNRHTIPWKSPSGAEVLLPVYRGLFPVLKELYFPPTDNRLRLEGPSIRVLNGSSRPESDRIAASQLVRDGLNAGANGLSQAGIHAHSNLFDYSGATKGSLNQRIAELIGIEEERIYVRPNPGREVDYEVVIGEDYQPCKQPNVQRNL
ncbi:MAG: LCP family protein [Anaerolineaceae bacterium]|nr:LCP family protein [Anaerolineaceae bacterium]MDE0329525.1 LCP family protein [Anaerolineaceae bacterium]